MYLIHVEFFMVMEEHSRAYASIFSVPREEMTTKRVVKLHDSSPEGKSLGFQGVVLYPGRQQSIVEPSVSKWLRLIPSKKT